MITNWPLGQPKSDIYLFFVTNRNLADHALRIVQLFSGYFLLLLTGFFGSINATASGACVDAADIAISPRSELVMRCGHPRSSIQFEDEHPHLDQSQFALEPIEEDAPLPDKHALPPLIADAHVLLLSALYEYGDTDQQSILTTFFTAGDNEIFEWIEEDLYVMEFFKDIYPVQLIDQIPDYALTLPVNIKVACICPGGETPEKWNGTGNLFLDFPVQKGALKSITLTNSAGSRFDGALDFIMTPATDNLFISTDAEIQFQIDGGNTHSWNASIHGAINGARANATTGHFAAGDIDLEAGLIGHFKSFED